MSKFRAVLFCGLLISPAMASAEDLAPVALNSLSAAPSNVASLQVMDQKGQVIGQALRIQSDQDGRPAALAFRANNGSTVVISAAATSYDGHALVTSNDQPQIAALSSSVRTAAN
ncbi:MAG TPA: hypothetical protein VHX18_07505 [Rhizomicrobium sp.]|jgi:hypothetical protein|nr:hypothetical protein [Rhizomicrobium sp.]